MEKRFCQNCGSELQMNTRFCPRCGSVVSTNNGAVMPRPNAKKKSNNTLYALLAVLGALVLIVFGVLIYTNSQENKTNKKTVVVKRIVDSNTKNSEDSNVPDLGTTAPKVTASDRQSGIIKPEGGYTNVRSSPSTNGDIVYEIKDGTPITFKVYNANWYIVYDSNGSRLGYVHSSKIVPTGSNVNHASVTNGTQYDWLSKRYMNSSDVAGMSSGQLRTSRNSIFARHGKIFKDPNLRNYFNSKSWYTGYRDEVPTSELNEYEKYNIEFIKKYE